MSELRSLAKTCNFGVYLDTALRDQFMCRLNKPQIQQELLGIQDLTMSKALEKGRSMEAVLKETKNFRLEEECDEHTNTDRGGMHKLSRELQSSCYHCGGSGHISDYSFHRNKKCSNCGKMDILQGCARAAEGEKRMEVKARWVKCTL